MTPIIDPPRVTVLSSLVSEPTFARDTAGRISYLRQLAGKVGCAMSTRKDPSLTPIFSLQKYAADRGDGLHPRVIAALAKSGSVSGPPAGSGARDDNVVLVEFKQGVKTSTRRQS